MNNRSSSPLRFLDLTDTQTAADITAEKARELSAAYEQVNDLQAALSELLGLLKTIEHNERGVSQAVRESLATNAAIIDARELLR